MLKAALHIAAKDLRLSLAGGGGLTQALLLGLLLLFVFSLSRGIGEIMEPQGAATIFWLASAFCQVLVFNTLYSLEEQNGARGGLLLMPWPLQSVWLGKGLAGFVLILLAQALFIPAAVVFLGQNVSALWAPALGMVLLADVGLAASGSLLGALAQGQAGRESLLSIIVFPLLIPLLLAGIRVGAAGFSAVAPEGIDSWFGVAAAFDALFCAAGLLLFGFIYGED